MNLKISGLIWLLPAFVLTTACQDGVESEQSSTNDTDNNTISFSAEITRAGESSFEQNDQISVTAYDTDGIAHDSNVEYTYSIGFKSDSPIEYESQNHPLSFIALYPYTELASDKIVEFSVKSNQNEGSNYTLSDFMVSYVDSTIENSPLLIFERLMSKITINISSSDVTLTNTSAVIHALASADIDISSGESTAKGSLSDITMKSVDSNTFEVIIPVQTVASGETLATISVNGTPYELIYYAEQNFKSGKEYTCDISLIDGEVYLY